MKSKLIYSLENEAEMLERRLVSQKRLYSKETLVDVANIFDQVEREGDHAIISCTQQFDQISIDGLVISDSYIQACLDRLSNSLREAIYTAMQHIQEVNQLLLPKPLWQKEIREGTMVGEKYTPLDSVGLWIPARKGPLISTALMLVVAAKTAGVKKIVVGMPPNKEGMTDPNTVAAAKLAGADIIVVGNGVSIIAGMAMGTRSIPEVDAIFGPGPGGIAAAMSVAQAYGKKTIVGFGPSEAVIMADEASDPRILAYDLLNEAEHGPDSSSILLTTSPNIAKEVEIELKRAIDKMAEPRKSYLLQVFGETGRGAIIVGSNWSNIINFVNQIAPEHLMIHTSEVLQKEFLSQLKHAGEILLGRDTAFSAANYAIGITAVLPTNRFAKGISGITSRDMLKAATIGSLNKDALMEMAPMIEELARYEGLPSHAEAVIQRKK